MEILAHRAFREGVDLARENTLEAVIECLREGWGVEIDIRRDQRGLLYISHDPVTDGTVSSAGSYFSAIRDHGRVRSAINVKELGYEAELARFFRQQAVLDQTFVFDMELLEVEVGASSHAFRQADPDIGIAARVSDRGEPVERALRVTEARFIWLDEFDSLWVSGRDIERLVGSGRTVFVISPEIHGFSLEIARERWKQFNAWGVHGICTDYPALLSQERSHW